MEVLVRYVFLFRLATYRSDQQTCSLNDVKDTKKIGPDGRTIGGRMQKLCDDVAADIKKCANVCDAYLK